MTGAPNDPTWITGPHRPGSPTDGTLPPQAPAPLPGSSSGRVPASGAPRIGPYEVVREISRGGQGLVLEARHLHLGTTVALKLLLDPSQARRFRQEGQVLVRMSHPNLIRVTDLGEEQGRPYMAMELIRGVDLKGWVRERGVPPLRWTARVLAQVADALELCHAAGVTHRDLKPANVLIEGEGERPVLVDFGLIRRQGDGFQSVERPESLVGEIKGTPAYMAPEQADGGEDVGPAADVYALGSTLYYLLTGEAPFQGPTPMNVITQVLRDPAPDPRDRRPEVPAAVARLCRQAMAKEPGERPASAAAFADALREAAAATGGGSKLALALGGAALLAVGLGVGWLAQRGADPTVSGSPGASPAPSASQSPAPSASESPAPSSSASPAPSPSPSASPSPEAVQMRGPAKAAYPDLPLPGQLLSPPVFVDVDGDGVKELAGVCVPAGARGGNVVLVDFKRRLVRETSPRRFLTSKSAGVAWRRDASGGVQLLAGVLCAEPGPHLLRLDAASWKHELQLLGEGRKPPLTAVVLAGGGLVMVLRPDEGRGARLLGLGGPQLETGWSLDTEEQREYASEAEPLPDGGFVWRVGHDVFVIDPPAPGAPAKAALRWKKGGPRGAKLSDPGALPPLVAVTADGAELFCAWRSEDTSFLAALGVRDGKPRWQHKQAERFVALACVEEPRPTVAAVVNHEGGALDLMERGDGTHYYRRRLPPRAVASAPLRVWRGPSARFVALPTSGASSGLWGLKLPDCGEELRLAAPTQATVATVDLEGDGVDELVLALHDPPRLMILSLPR
ncbi:MAG: serine/threonine-protein kinase [Planctomycetota bacterium]